MKKLLTFSLISIVCTVNAAEHISDEEIEGPILAGVPTREEFSNLSPEVKERLKKTIKACRAAGLPLTNETKAIVDTLTDELHLSLEVVTNMLAIFNSLKQEGKIDSSHINLENELISRIRALQLEADDSALAKAAKVVTLYYNFPRNEEIDPADQKERDELLAFMGAPQPSVDIAAIFQKAGKNNKKVVGDKD
jgi:hypothetical protein